MNERSERWTAWALLSWTTVTLVLLLVPGSAAESDGGLWDRLPEETDKLVHALLFLGQGYFLARWAAERGSRRPFAFALLTALFLATSTEIAQHFIPERSAELADWLADVAGAVAGGWLAVKPRFSSERILDERITP